MKRKLMALSVALFSVLVLSGCQSKQVKKNIETRENYAILYTYNEDKTKSVLTKKKTVRQLAKDLMYDQLGISAKGSPYKEVGISDDDGIFVSSGVTDGNGIPKTPALSEQEAQDASTNANLFYENKKKDSYDELSKSRQTTLKQNEAELGTDQERMMESIQDKIDAQNKEVAKNKAKLAKEDSKSSED